MSERKTLARDVCLIVSLLAVAFVILLVQRSNSKQGSWAVVAIEGNEIARYPLSVDGSYTLNGGTNIILIRDNGVLMIDADCPDKLCVKQGFIKYTGQCITCLPNKMTVTVTGADSSVDIIL